MGEIWRNGSTIIGCSKPFRVSERWEQGCNTAACSLAVPWPLVEHTDIWGLILGSWWVLQVVASTHLHKGTQTDVQCQASLPTMS